MRVIIAFLATLFTTSVLHAQSVKITGERAFNVGIYEQTEKREGKKDSSISTGTLNQSPVRFLRAATTIPMNVKVFGADFDISGSPRGATKQLRVVWRYPSPGINGRLI